MPPQPTDPVDTYGHTVAQAENQQPLLNSASTPASTTNPTGGEEVFVLAQTVAEVNAQLANAVAES